MIMNVEQMARIEALVEWAQGLEVDQLVRAQEFIDSVRGAGLELCDYLVDVEDVVGNALASHGVEV